MRIAEGPAAQLVRMRAANCRCTWYIIRGGRPSAKEARRAQHLPASPRGQLIVWLQSGPALARDIRRLLTIRFALKRARELLVARSRACTVKREAGRDDYELGNGWCGPVEGGTGLPTAGSSCSGVIKPYERENIALRMVNKLGLSYSECGSF